MGRDMTIESFDFCGSKAQKAIIYKAFKDLFKENKFEQLVASVPKKTMENFLSEAFVFIDMTSCSNILSDKIFEKDFISKWKYLPDKEYDINEVFQDFKNAVYELNSLYWRILHIEPKIKRFLIDYN